MAIELELDGLGALERALSIKEHALRAAMERAMNQIVSGTHRVMADHLRVYTHPLGTPTTSPAGHPPALVTGNLIRSIRESGPTWVGNYRIEASVGPTAVYARIQEKGGVTGANYATHLPPRPYVGPTTREMKPRAFSILRAAISDAMRA